jgi:putative PepSY-like beta-lactamase-inhibitor
MTMLRLLVVFAAGMLVVPAGVRADEEKVPLDKLPKAVADAVKAKFPKAELVSADKEKDNGKEVFEVNIKHEGASIDVTVTPEGKIVLIEKTIAAKDLPKAVADALKAKYPDATIKKVEEISKDDKIEKYEALIVAKDKQLLEVSFDPTGKFLEEEKKKSEKD